MVLTSQNRTLAPETHSKRGKEPALERDGGCGRMSRMKPAIPLSLTLTILFLLVAKTQAKEGWQLSSSDKPVKVFILAGQSNMEGKGFPEPLAWQVSQEAFRERWTHVIENGDYEAFAKAVADSRDPDDPRKQPEYKWSVRKDVWVNYLEKRGDLTVGYGTPRNGLGLLLIKTAWGGRALDRGFLPPSSMKSAAEYDKEAAATREQNKTWNAEQEEKVAEYNAKIEESNKTAAKDKQKKPRRFKARAIPTDEEYRAQWGKDYRNMMQEIRDCLAELEERFPGYRGQGTELVGFVWFQGWNDQYNDRWLQYEKNLGNLIRDVRKDLDAPELKFVIGQMGHDGMKEDKPDSPRDYIKKAQAAVPASDEFKTGARCVKTDQYWDLEAHAIYTGPGGWSKDVARWRQHGNDRGYHYYGSPWTFAQIGTGFGEAMLELVKAEK